MRSTRIENTLATDCVTIRFDRKEVSYDRLNMVATSGLPLGCVRIGGKSTYAISCVSPRSGMPNTSSLRRLCIMYRATIASAFILRRCATVTLFVYQVRRLLERACRTDAGAITPSTHARLCSNSPLAIVGAFHFARIGIGLDFKIFANKTNM